METAVCLILQLIIGYLFSVFFSGSKKKINLSTQYLVGISYNAGNLCINSLIFSVRDFAVASMQHLFLHIQHVWVLYLFEAPKWFLRKSTLFSVFSLRDELSSQMLELISCYCSLLTVGPQASYLTSPSHFYHL